MRHNRVYCGLKMNRRRIGKKRFPTRDPQPLAVPGEINKSWSIDFMSDALWCGRLFRTFNVVDDFTGGLQFSGRVTRATTLITIELANILHSKAASRYEFARFLLNPAFQ